MFKQIATLILAAAIAGTTIQTAFAADPDLIKIAKQIKKIEAKPLRFSDPHGFKQAGDYMDVEITAYDGDGKEIDLTTDQANDLFSLREPESLNNPVGSKVATLGQDGVISPLEPGKPYTRNYVRVVAGADTGAAKLTVTMAKEYAAYSKATARHLIGVGGTPTPQMGFQTLANKPSLMQRSTAFAKTHPYITAGSAVGVVAVGAAAGGGGGGGGGGGSSSTATTTTTTSESGGGGLSGSISGGWSGTATIDGETFSVNGTFVMNISSSGAVTGSYSGDDSGSIAGSVTGSGSLSASGSAGGAGWSGNISGSSGSLSGSGRWSSSEGSGGWSGSGG